MKIRIVGTAYPMRGGIAHYVAILFSYLNKDNDVKIYSFKRQYPNFLFPGKTQYETKEPPFKIPDDKNIISVDSINPINWFVIGYKIRKENPDLIIYKYWMPFFAPCYTIISFIAKFRRKTKVLYICDNIIPHEKRIGDIMLTKIAFSTVDYCIVQSKTVENDLKRINIRKKEYIYSPHPIYDIFGPITEKNNAKEFIKNKYNINLSNQKTILFFGYVRKYKGLLYLLKAMPELINEFNLNLLVAGEFYEDDKPYKKIIKELNIEKNVHIFSEFISDDEVKYFFSSCDCLVLPYTSATQSGIVQIAYFFNKPVISTNVGGLGEVIISETTGILIPPNNTEAIISSVKRFYKDELEDKFSENIKAIKDKYTWEYYINNLYNLIK